MDWPKVCVMLLTYNRMEYAERTLRSILDNLSYSGPLCVHIADDGSGQEYQEALVKLAGGYAHVQGVGATDSNRGGYGANYNLATHGVHNHSQLVLPPEADWELTRPFDLDPLVIALAEGKISCIRLGYLGITQPMRGELVVANERIWLLFDPESEERHIFSGHPRLETVEWEQALGVWDEGLDPNQTEFNVSALPSSRRGVVWPLCFLPAAGGLFVHIGTDRARHELPKEAVLVEAE